MCFLVDDDDDESGVEKSNTGNAKLQLRHHHTWLIPRKPLMLLVTVAILMVFLGIVMMAIGGGIGSGVLSALGGVSFGLGIIALIVCFLVCLFAYFWYGTKDQAVQTDGTWMDEYTPETPGYATIGRPSALKSPDSTLKRNGIMGPKKVTMAPELGQYGEIPAGGSAAGMQSANSNSMGPVGTISGSGSGTGFVSGSAGGPGVGGDNILIGSPASSSVGHHGHGTMSSVSSSSFGGGNNASVMYGGGQGMIIDADNSVRSGTLSRGGTIDGSMSGTLPRGASGVDGSTVGTGGIRITPLDGSQPFPSPGSSISYGGSTGQYHSLQGGGGGSSAGSSMVETYAYPKSVLTGGSVSGSGTMVSTGYDGSGSSSQYSTLRSIPVTHIVTDSQKQKQQQQQFREDTVEYARVNKPGKGSGSQHQTVRVDIAPQNIVTSQGQHGQVQGQMQMSSSSSFQQRQFCEEDLDYDNPVERTPMIPQSPMSYHQQQMQYQRQQRLQHHPQQQHHQHQHPQMLQNQQDLHAPRQINSYSLQRQTAANPFHFNQQQQQQVQQQQQQVQQQQLEQHQQQPQLQSQPQKEPQFQTLFEKQKYEHQQKLQQEHQQQQQHQYNTISNTTSSTRNSTADEFPPPQPLVYPSARRPMTFEQVSSSKMSVYDNVLANNLREDEEE